MTLTLPAYFITRQIQHNLACAGFGRVRAATALRNDRSFQHNQGKTQNGRKRRKKGTNDNRHSLKENKHVISQ